MCVCVYTYTYIYTHVFNQRNWYNSHRVGMKWSSNKTQAPRTKKDDFSPLPMLKYDRQLLVCIYITQFNNFFSIIVGIPYTSFTCIA